MAYGMNTFFIMGDGSVKQAGEIRAGDYMLGPDSKPHKVVSTRGDKKQLYKISFADGFYTCTADQLLCVKSAPSSGNEFINLTELYGEGGDFRQNIFGVRCGGVDFQEKPVPIDPYIMGVIMGNERYMRRVRNDSIQFPKICICNSREVRICFLTALIDTYGEICDDKLYLDFNDEGRARDTLFLVKSLGGNGWIDKKGVLVVDSLALTGYMNPCLLNVYKINIEPTLSYGAEIEKLDGTEYVSYIELEDNSLMLLDDFTMVPDCSGMVGST